MEIRDITNFEELTIPEASNVIGGTSSSNYIDKQNTGKLSKKMSKYKLYTAYCAGAGAGNPPPPPPRRSRP